MSIGARTAAILTVFVIIIPAGMFSDKGARNSEAKSESARPGSGPPIRLSSYSEDAFGTSPYSVRSRPSTDLAPAKPSLTRGKETAHFYEDAKTTDEPYAEPIGSTLSSSPPQPAAAVDFDFDGDGKSDLSRWHPANTEFKIKNSNGGSYSTYTTVGTSSDKLAPADYDGDAKTDVATFNAGTWKIWPSASCSPPPSSCTITTVTGFGQAGDIPMSGNYRGTSASADELAFYRPSNGTWYWRELGNSTVYSQAWGQSGDIPVVGDYEGDGLMDPAIFRPSTGYWYFVQSSNSNQVNVGWGQSGDVPLAGDFDADGKTDLTVFRPSSGMWYVKKSSTSYSTWLSQAWGNYDDQPVAGDFDGDSKAENTKRQNRLWKYEGI